VLAGGLGAEAEGADRALDVGGAGPGEDDDLGAGGPGLHRLQHAETVELGHLQVGQDDVVFARRLHLDPDPAVGGFGDLVSLAGEAAPDRLTDGARVVHEQHAPARGGGSRGFDGALVVGHGAVPRRMMGLGATAEIVRRPFSRLLRRPDTETIAP
jgi:hypothetical protein